MGWKMLVVAVLLLGHFSLVLAKPVVPVKFCYESKELYPSYLGDSEQIPDDRPGAIVDILRALDEQRSDIVVSYIRHPWLRCVKALEDGEVDALVMSYSSERANFAQFPYKNGRVDNKKAISENESCLLHQIDSDVSWQGKRIVMSKPLTVSMPAGYQSSKYLRTLGFNVLDTDSSGKAYQLVKAKRTDGTLVYCSVTDYPSSLVMLKPAIIKHYGYLVFSKPFYKYNTKLAEDVWTSVAGLDSTRFFAAYPMRLETSSP